MSIAAVDFDGTLYQGNTLMPMLKTSKKELTIKQWYSIMLTFFKMALSKESKREKDLRVVFMRAFFTQMKGKNKKELHSFFMSAIENGEQGINQEMLSRIAEHIERGDRVIIISGTLNPFLETFIQHSNIKADVIGTPLILDENGTCTGEIGKFNHGAMKIEKLKHWIEQNNAGAETIWAYADSESDLPLLEFADKAVVVNPSNSLKKIAEAKGWEVLSK